MTKVILGSLLVSTGFVSAATCVVQFSSGTSTIATGFADASGSAAAGLTWGIIVSNGDSTFSPIPANFVLSTTTTATSGTRIGTSNDYYFGSAVLTANQTTGAEAGALGKIGSLGNITKGASATTGSSFALVWFDRSLNTASTPGLGTVAAGTSYGLLTDANFVVPADGATVFVGTTFSAPGDAIKSANTVTVIPEASTAFLGAIGALGLLRRRRN